LTEPNAVPLIVLSSARDPVEAINSLLRRAGQPVHCTWIPALRDLADALTQINPQLLVQVAGSAAELNGAVGVRDQFAPTVPVLLLARRSMKPLIADAPSAAARDVVTLASPARLQAVILRELQVFHTERALAATESPRTTRAASSTWCCSAPTTPSSGAGGASLRRRIPPGTSSMASRRVSPVSR
jgi:hypothetical protein